MLVIGKLLCEMVPLTTGRASLLRKHLELVCSVAALLSL